MRSSRHGLTVLEVLFATLLLTVCVIFVITAMLGMFRSATKGQDQTVALELADKLLTQLSDADSSYWTQIVDDPNVLYTHDPEAPTTFKAEFRYINADTLTMGNLYAVTVTVFWWPDAAGNNVARQGYGRQSVTLTRTVYEQKSP